jgi:hypothetical protein
MKVKRRSDKLKKMNHVQYDTANLSKLFRIFDEDNSRKIGQREFQSGLIAMGHEGAERLSVVDHMMKEIDMDASGYITEPEFIRYLQKTRFEELANNLKGFHQVGTVRVVEYGLDESEYADSGVLNMEDPVHCEIFGKLLREPSAGTRKWTGAVRRWSDINGFQEETMKPVANLFQLHEETMKDCGIFQRQKMEVLAQGGGGVVGSTSSAEKRVISCHAAMVVHLLSFQEKKNKHGAGRIYGMNTQTKRRPNSPSIRIQN